MISIALIEDNRLVREGISALLSPVPDMKVVAAGASVDTTFLGELKANIVLLDLGLRNGDSLRLAGRVKQDAPESRVIVMDLLPVHEEIVEFVNVGVSGFIMKDATLDDLVGTIRTVAGGLPVLPPQMAGTLFSQIARRAVARDPHELLESVRMTKREREVIALIGEGLSNKQIAGRLHIATHTVKSHLRNVMEKLALHTRLEIAAYVHREEPVRKT